MAYRCHACEVPTKTSICDRCAVQVNAFKALFLVSQRNGVNHLESFVHSLLATADEKMDKMVEKYGERQMLDDLNSFKKLSALFHKYKESADKSPFLERMKKEIESIKSEELKKRLLKMFF